MWWKDLCLCFAAVSNRTTRSRCWRQLTLSPSMPRTSWMSSTNHGSRWWRTPAHISAASAEPTLGPRWFLLNVKTPGVKMRCWSWEMLHWWRKWLWYPWQESVKNHLTLNPAETTSAFFWALTLPHCDFLATRTETKMLPESGIWQLHSPWTGIKTRKWRNDG